MRRAKPVTMFGGISSEMPPYELLEKKDGYEVRRYQKQYWAQLDYDVPKETDFGSKASEGFWPLFQYISGQNSEQMKISMTAPVVMKQVDEGDRTKRSMSFLMSPSKFHSLEELPQANNQRIQIVEEKNDDDFACITFNMTMTKERNAQKEEELRQAARRDGIRLSTNPADVRYFGYNAPFTIPYFRRNEIAIPIVRE